MSRRIYLDFNASTPVAPEAVEAIRPFLIDPYGNPSSLQERREGERISSRPHFRF